MTFLKNIILSIPKEILLFFGPISLLSAYSLFLGTYNSTYQTDVVPIAERFLRLPLGIYYQFTQKLGFPVLFFLITLNVFIIKKRFYNEEGKKIINSIKWIGIFALLYILLLPLGGYRPYRLNILRYDTIIPITIGLFYIYGASTYFLLKNVKRGKPIYYGIIVLFLIIFINADKSSLTENKCEKQALITISNSNKRIVPIENNCTVLSWKPIVDYKSTKLNSKLLMIWNITSKEKLYYNKPAANKAYKSLVDK